MITDKVRVFRSEDIGPITYTGQVTVGTSVVQLSSSSVELIKGMVIKADSGNTGNVYAGGNSSVSTSNGFKLAPGEGIFIEVENANLVYLIADASGQKVYAIGV